MMKIFQREREREREKGWGGGGLVIDKVVLGVDMCVI